MTVTEDLLRAAFERRVGDVADAGVPVAQVLAAHRTRRRWELAGAGAAVATVLLLIALVVPLAGRTSVDPANPAYPPPRGSLAGDRTVLAAALAAPWDRFREAPNAPVETRQVIFVGEVPGGSVWARVVGLVDGTVYGVWLRWSDSLVAEGTIYAGFGLLAGPAPVDLQQVDSFSWGTVDGQVVIIGRPGDQFSLSERPEVGADGRIFRSWRELTTTDGVAVTTRSHAGTVAIGTTRDGVTTVSGLTAENGYQVACVCPYPVAESPDALGGFPDQNLLRRSVEGLQDALGMDLSDSPPVVVWAGQVGTDNGVLLRATLPSGATVSFGACGPDGFVSTGPAMTFSAEQSVDSQVQLLGCPDGIVAVGPPDTTNISLDLSDGNFLGWGLGSGKPQRSGESQRVAIFTDEAAGRDLADSAEVVVRAEGGQGGYLGVTTVGSIVDLLDYRLGT